MLKGMCLGTTKVEAETLNTEFGYGSNSRSQLRGRVKSYSMHSEAAELVHFKRCFCLSPSGWGGGSVASVAPCTGSIVKGSVVRLTSSQLTLLDYYEM